MRWLRVNKLCNVNLAKCLTVAAPVLEVPPASCLFPLVLSDVMCCCY